jgi:hypothetical protein
MNSPLPPNNRGQQAPAQPPVANVPRLQLNPDIWHNASPVLNLGQQNTQGIVGQLTSSFNTAIDASNVLQAITGINQLVDALSNLSQSLQNTLGCFGTGLASVATGLAAAATAYAATDAQLAATIQGLEAQLPAFTTIAATTPLAALPYSTIPGLSTPLTTTAVYSQLAMQHYIHTDATSSSSHGSIFHSAWQKFDQYVVHDGFGTIAGAIKGNDGIAATVGAVLVIAPLVALNPAAAAAAL